MTFEEIRFMNDEDRKNKMASLPFAKEALEFITESLDSKIALLIGHFLVYDTGSSEYIWKLISSAVEELQCWEMSSASGTDVAELRHCKFICQECTNNRQLCKRCKTRGFSTDQWKSSIRPCFSSAESLISSKRVVACVLASDCLEKQKKILRQLEEKRSSSEAEEAKGKSTGEILLIPSPDDPYTDKNIVAKCMTITGK